MIMRFVLLMFLALSGANLCFAQSQDAFVESVKGTAWLRNAGDSRATRLKTQTGLFSGQRVICAGGCKELTISYCNRTIKVGVPQNSKGKLIVAINCNSVKGVRGGGSKGE